VKCLTFTPHKAKQSLINLGEGAKLKTCGTTMSVTAEMFGELLPKSSFVSTPGLGVGNRGGMQNRCWSELSWMCRLGNAAIVEKDQ